MEATLSTTESILIDGANGVTSAPRAHFPDGAMWLAAAVVVAVVVRFVKRPAVMLGLLAIGALPGLVVLSLRADGPSRRGAIAEAISSTLGSMQVLVPWPQSQVSVVREDDVLFPLARYALPSRGTGPVELELRDGPLGPTCRADGQRVICGGP